MAPDAAIQGTAYPTFTFVSNSKYNVEDCLKFCDATPSCSIFLRSVIILSFREPLLPNDHSTANSKSDTSNLKCVPYADVHTGDEKTNWGNQTYIQQNSDTPQGYEYVFGPVNAANNARGVIIFPLSFPFTSISPSCSIWVSSSSIA